ncbi:MAG: LexA repressor [Syntrophorhabdaceae bacterium PtaU1.Bin034]|nr:MAG: LexA repressor [Syntrophorhabdaceae bacterium PtaU1.Bin034]
MEIEVIRELLKKELEKGKRQIVLANEIGVSHATIYKLINTNTRPTTDTLAKIARYFKVSVSEFLEPDARGYPCQESIGRDVRKIPVIDRLRKDASAEGVKDEAAEYLWLSDVPEGTRVTVAKEEAMAPLIKKGDYVLFRTDREVKEDDIVVVEDEWMDLIIRRMKKKKGQIFLAGENPEYKPVPVTEKLRIVGKAVEVLSRRRI